MLVSKKNFLSFLIPAFSIASKEKQNQILGNFYLKAENERLVLKATNLEMVIGSVFPFSDEKLPVFEGLVPANVLFNLVKQMPDSFYVFYKNGKLLFKSEKEEIEFEFKLETPDVFPSFNIPGPLASLTFLAGELYNILSSVSFSLPGDGKSYLINGICLDFREEQGYAVATNGFSLAYALLLPLKVEGNLEGDHIIPASAVQEFIKVLKLLPPDALVILYLHGNFVSLACNISGFDHQIVTSCIDTRFIDWRNFLTHEYSATITFTPIPFLDVLKRIKIIATKTFHAAFISPVKSGIEIKINVSDVGEAREVFKADISGDFSKIGFDVFLLINAFKPLQKESVVEVDLRDSDTPMRIRGKNYTCLVMPCVEN